MEIERHSVAVQGGELAVFELGEELAPARTVGGPGQPPVVLALHGTTATSRVWLPVARLMGNRARLITPDIRGRGASGMVKGRFGLDAHAADLLAILDQLELDQVVLAGHSLGAYIAAQFAVWHPERVRAVVLVDGGLASQAPADTDYDAVTEALLGPALARLGERYATRLEYYDWWHRHPALARGDVPEEDLRAYADHDLVGAEPELRSSVSERAVREDSVWLLRHGGAAGAITQPAWLLCAPRGLQDEPNPLQPWDLVQEWAQARPDRRRASLVEDSNHYTIMLAPRGAQAVSDALRAAAG